MKTQHRKKRKRLQSKKQWWLGSGDQEGALGNDAGIEGHEHERESVPKLLGRDAMTVPLAVMRKTGEGPVERAGTA